MKSIVPTIMALSLTMVSGAAAAQSTEYVLPCSGRGFFGWGAGAATPEQRRDFAEYLAAPLRELAPELPRPSPSEERWLDDELNSGSQQRNIAASASIENQKRRALLFTIDRLALLDRLQAPEPSGELMLWAQLASSLIEHNFGRSLAALGEAKIIDSKFLGFFGDAEVINFSCKLHAQEILHHILIPQLAGRR